jgi:outer membrane receptor for ferrienterochelin and colicin
MEPAILEAVRLDKVSDIVTLCDGEFTDFNFDAIEELEVITAGLSPEYGNTSGGVINVVTKGGSNEFELDSSFKKQLGVIEALEHAKHGQKPAGWTCC